MTRQMNTVNLVQAVIVITFWGIFFFLDVDRRKYQIPAQKNVYCIQYIEFLWPFHGLLLKYPVKYYLIDI